MIRIRFIFSILLLSFNIAFGQSVKLSCFDKEVKNQDFNYPLLIRTCFIKNFKFICTSYPDDVGRYFDEKHEVFIRINKKYIATTNSKVFNKNQNKLVAIINKRIQQDFNSFSTAPETKDCLTNIDSIPTYKMNDFEISFNGVEIWFEVHWDLSMACRAVDGTIISFKMTEIEKYLN